jgi:uncharacterized metal-binding protein YceD (DUF177 family)
MRSEYSIPFVGLKNGKHSFDYTIETAFFDLQAYDDFSNVQIHVQLEMNKKEQLLELDFHAKGTVEVPCDLSMELFNLEVNTKYHQIVKFGVSTESSDDDILILPHGTYEIDVAQSIYEMIVLAVPQKKIHPQVLDGTMQSDILEKLKELAPKESINKDQKTDPRWDKLKDLL